MLRMPMAASVLFVVFALVAQASPPAFDAVIGRRIAESALNGRSLEYTRDLTSTVGARVTGSPSFRRAVDWGVRQFRDAGVTAVTTERFAIARGWERVSRASARIVSPVQQTLTLESMGWAPSTPPDGIEAEVVTTSGGTLRPDRVRDRIVLVDGGAPRELDRRLKEAGALAMLFPDPDPEGRLAARVRAFGGAIALLPSAAIARDDAALLRRLIGRGPVRMAMVFQNTISDGPVPVDNVIAEIKGRDDSGELVVVGAHLDSWDFAPAAQDNAAGVAMVLEAARSIAALGRPPRRTIRFALWAGEEQGLLGSSAYVDAHARELDRTVAVLNADGGTGRVIGWTTPGRDDVAEAVRGLSRAVLSDLQTAAVDRSMQYAFDSDAGPFIRAGIPALDLNVDDRAYEEIHHKATDTMDLVNARNLAVGAATVAVTAYTIADMPGRIARRGPGTGDMHDFASIGDPLWLDERGLFVAEGRLVLRRVLADPRYRVASIMLNEASRRDLADAIDRLPPAIPVFVRETREFEALTGFHLHRGCLALVHRPAPVAMDDLIRRPGPLLVLEAVANPDNVGGVFRNAAALGAAGVVLSPTAGDPLYRKAVRTSMAAVLSVPFARAEPWPQALERVRAAGFTLVALTPREPSTPLDVFARGAGPAGNMALIVGTEGDGVSAAVDAIADARVRIPMTGRVDSLNVSVAVGIALYALNGSPPDPHA